MNHIKIFFGVVIFLFSLALSYFTASYLNSNNLLDYWVTLALFSGLYVLLGIMVVNVFPISLGFLFAADILLVNILFEYYGKWASEVKTLIVGLILVALYFSAWSNLKDRQQSNLLVSE